METTARLKYARISPQKARQAADLIRGKDVADAQAILEYSNKAAARLMNKLLVSAVANAENNDNLDADDLYVSRAYVDEGPTLKRWRPRALGRATRINKRSSHITIVLEEREVPESGKRRRFIRRPKRKKEETPEEVEGEMEEALDEDESPEFSEEDLREEGAEDVVEEEMEEVEGVPIEEAESRVEEVSEKDAGPQSEEEIPSIDESTEDNEAQLSEGGSEEEQSVKPGGGPEGVPPDVDMPEGDKD